MDRNDDADGGEFADVFDGQAEAVFAQDDDEHQSQNGNHGAIPNEFVSRDGNEFAKDGCEA